MSTFNRLITHPRTYAVLLLVIGASVIGGADRLESVSGYTALNDYAESLVDDALTKNFTIFAGLSAIKGAVALIEGSSVGVGFQLELGDLIQPAYDYIDFVWQMFLYAFMLLGFYKILLEAELLNAGIYLIGAGLIVWSLAVWQKSWRAKLNPWARRLVLVGAIFSLVLPLSLVVTHHVSTYYLTGIKEKNMARMTQAQLEFGLIKLEFMELREKISIYSPSESMTEIRNKLVELAGRVSDSASQTLFAFLYYTVILLCELLVLPFVTAYLLSKILSYAIGSLQPVAAGVPPASSEPVPA
ncbi:MAG: hypothetical protein AMXMBFR84_47180 [Candidatus Hydrogenedentota bacterium]